MTTPNETHKKVLVESGVLGRIIFADYFSYYTDHETTPPLIFFFSGHPDLKGYTASFDRIPYEIVNEFRIALNSLGRPAISLLVVPTPPIDQFKDRYHDLCYIAKAMAMPSAFELHQTSRSLRKEYLYFIENELLPEVGIGKPPVLGYVGHSFGAYLATCMLFDHTGSVAMAAIGGVGMAEAAMHSDGKSFAGKKFISFANKEDHLFEESEKFQRVLELRGKEMELISGQGSHDFHDYAATGAVAKGFQFIIESLIKSSGKN